VNTTVSANGHVVKTVKSKSFGITTIVDDQADVELERSNLAVKRNSEEQNKVESQSDQTSSAQVTKPVNSGIATVSSEAGFVSPAVTSSSSTTGIMGSSGVASLPVKSSISSAPVPSPVVSVLSSTASLPISMMTSSGIVPMTSDMSSGGISMINSGMPATFHVPHHHSLNSNEGGLSIQGNHGMPQMSILTEPLSLKVGSQSVPVMNPNSGAIPFSIVNMDGGQTVLTSDLSVVTGQDSSPAAVNAIHPVSDMCTASSASPSISSVQVSVLNVDQQHQHLLPSQQQQQQQQVYMPPPDLQGNVGMLMSPEDPLRHTDVMSPENQDYEAELSPESVLDDITPKPKTKKPKKRRISCGSGDKDDGTSEDNKKRCYVCGDKAGPHSYYGGQVCTSCRAFFRRTVINTTKDTYFCLRNGDCLMNFKTRKHCQFCRYEKCVKAGMKPSWVQEKDQNQKIKTEDESCSKKAKYASSDDGENNTDEYEHLIYITADEINTIDKLVHNWESHANSKIGDIDTLLIKDLIRMVSFGKDLTSTGFLLLTTTLKKRLTKAVSEIKEIHSLCKEDRDEILNQNLPLLVKLSIAAIISPEKSWDKQLESLLGVVDIQMLSQKLIAKSSGALKSVRYDQIFNCKLKTHEIEQEEEFIKVMVEMRDWPTNVKEMVLISMLVLFCSSSLQLQDRLKIDDIQAHFGEILFNYLRHRHGKEKGRTKFGRAVHLINKCQRLHVLEHKH